MFALVFDRLLEDANAGFVAEFLDLFGVLCDVAAFVQLQPPQRHPNTACTIGEGVGFTGFGPLIHRVRSSQRANALGPKLGMVLLCMRQSVERGAPSRIAFSLGQYFIGVESPHLSLPIAFENFEDASAIARVHFRIGARCVCAHVTDSSLRTICLVAQALQPVGFLPRWPWRHKPHRAEASG